MLNSYWYLGIKAPCVSLALGSKLGGLLKMKILLLKSKYDHYFKLSLSKQIRVILRL